MMNRAEAQKLADQMIFSTNNSFTVSDQTQQTPRMPSSEQQNRSQTISGKWLRSVYAQPFKTLEDGKAMSRSMDHSLSVYSTVI
jgi:hypothetical protein